MTTTFRVRVVFAQRGVWSKPYSYNSDKAYEGLVVVPVGNFVSIAKVLDCVPVEAPDAALKTVLGNLEIRE